MTTETSGSLTQSRDFRETDLAASEGAAGILEQILEGEGKSVDRGQLRRVVREAVDAYPGDAADLWWRWIGEAGTNLGLKCKVVDCTPDEFRQLILDGARFVCYVPGTSPWRAVVETRRRKFRLAHASSDHSFRWYDTSNLSGLADHVSTGGTSRCVIIERAAAHGAVSSLEHTLSPPARLFALMRPERSDIFILFIFSVVVGLLTLAVPVASQSLVDTVAFGRFLQPVAIVALLLFMFLAFSAALQAMESYVAELIQCRLFARVAGDLAYRLPRVRAESHDQAYLPELANRFFDIVTVQKVTAKLLLDGLTLVLNTLIGMTVLALYHPWLLGFDALLVLMLSFIVFLLGRGAVATSIKESKYKYLTAAWLQDLARCGTAFKYDGGAELALERADQIISDYLSARKKHFRVLMRQLVFALSTQAVATAALLGIGGWLVMTGQLTLGQLVAAELIVTVIVASFAKLGGYMEIFYDLLASVDKLGVLFDLPLEKQEGVLHQFPEVPASLSVKNVDYTFPTGEPSLQSISLDVHSGERIALIGRQSSALFDLAFGLRNPARGHLALDGIDPRDIRPDFLRRRVALVRGIEVFQSTVVENVHLGRPEVTFNDVRDALERVGLLDRLLQLPQGIETQLSSSGWPLSENDLRRLMLARALVGRPGLLMIDRTLDTFSDSEAALLMGALCDPQQPWTLLIATSRANLQQQCNRVAEL